MLQDLRMLERIFCSKVDDAACQHVTAARVALEAGDSTKANEELDAAAGITKGRGRWGLLRRFLPLEWFGL